MSAFSLPFFFVLILSTTITITIPAQPYKATDMFFLDCGSSTPNSSSDQIWFGDEHSNFVPSNIRTTSFSLHSSDPNIPYSTARFFNTSSFTFTFPVSEGPIVVRLHFNPTTYSGLNTNESSFSVTSNGYSLLTNFNPFQGSSFSENTGTNAPIVKEFIFNVKDGQILNITFTPSPNSHAFINAIQINSLAENLYFKTKHLNYVGMINGPGIDNHTALENIYRLNMGGRHITFNEDTGMCRSWESDDNYLYSAEIGFTIATTNPIMYTMETPNYTAPDLLYQTQRSMGQLADKYNLTWLLPVDSGFYYMLRLHFCNIIPQYTKPGQIVFKIFINNQTAEQEADVFNWTVQGGNGYPVFKDYMVFVKDIDGRQRKQDLWLVMHPSPLKELYGDAYLNGLEAFKLSTFRRMVDPASRTPTVRGNKKKTPSVVMIGGISGAVVLLSILAFIVFRRRRVKHNGAFNDRSSNRCRRFSLAEMKAATDDFNHGFVIGKGGFGKVYKGCIDNATTIVAIKRLDSSSGQGFQEFHTEIEMLSKLSHVQLVSLIGYCDDEGEMILVYDYMAQGTLRENLYNTNKPSLSWKTRLNICIGASKGLHFLHSNGKGAIIHGDVKSTNILLDENWVAKLSDFGLSMLGSEDKSEAKVDTVVKGSLGYVDPEYCWTQQLTKKSDVYSFGVVLLEVLCARPVIVTGLKEEQVSLVEWGKTCYRKGTLREIVDPKLSSEIAPACLTKFGDVASKCLHEEGSERPAMEEVVWRLEFALQLQEDAEKMDGPNTIVLDQELSFLDQVNCKENLP